MPDQEILGLQRIIHKLQHDPFHPHPLRTLDQEQIAATQDILDHAASSLRILEFTDSILGEATLLCPTRDIARTLAHTKEILDTCLSRQTTDLTMQLLALVAKLQHIAKRQQLASARAMVYILECLQGQVRRFGFSIISIIDNRCLLDTRYDIEPTFGRTIIEQRLADLEQVLTLAQTHSRSSKCRIDDTLPQGIGDVDRNACALIIELEAETSQLTYLPLLAITIYHITRAHRGIHREAITHYPSHGSIGHAARFLIIKIDDRAAILADALDQLALLTTELGLALEVFQMHGTDRCHDPDIAGSDRRQIIHITRPVDTHLQDQDFRIIRIT